MASDESWEKYGFPDDVTFRSMYLPSVGLIKALNERLEAVGMEPVPVPGYFTPYEGSQSFTGRIDSKIFNELCYRFVNPEKIPSAQYYSACFWRPDELELAAADGVEEDVFHYHPLMPEFPVKWAIARYKAINLLRYVVTSDAKDWPDIFTYEDKNNTFNFKAP